ncbi:hypothetical protein GE061_016271 [Apolygus lucorum]|uniref:Uncharacterized protein n=1 Tax=Apolygus lucorum TaxID=248454 RepID=A0A8S9XFP7_APOLU|nr:hypothetical protein GE061_016271 [Apolygus lucorum]
MFKSLLGLEGLDFPRWNNNLSPSPLSWNVAETTLFGRMVLTPIILMMPLGSIYRVAKGAIFYEPTCEILRLRPTARST